MSAKALRALWVQGEDLVQSDPNETHVREALGKLDLLVVQELFLSETARLAHLVLPAAGALEQEGTFTNAERRIQMVRPAVPAPGEAHKATGVRVRPL
jgi:formate dehydrogenase major subunit